MNSLYGATANKFFIYYIKEIAEAITTSGQLSIRYAEKSINDYMNKILKTENVDYVYYCDTDSTYVNMAPIVQAAYGTVEIDRDVGEQFLDKVCREKIETIIANGYEELAKKMGAYRNGMTMKREKIADRGIFVAKKRYIMNTLNSEGVHYDVPKISVTGLESVRSSTPEICRDKMKEAFKVIMSGSEEELQAFISKFREEFNSLPAEEIGKTSGTDNIEKYMSDGTYKSGCPIHIRASILYNNHLVKTGLDKKYEKIVSGDKVKFVYLKQPNPIRENVIGFVGALPKEMDMEKYIDRETQFEKVFLKPLSAILDAVGWHAEHVATIEDFFS